MQTISDNSRSTNEYQTRSKRMPYVSRLAAVTLPLILLAGCRGGSAASAALPFAPQAREVALSSKIKHVIVVVQENRSLNNLFAGFPGARTVSYGFDSNDKKVPLKPVGLEAKWDISHNGITVITACNGVGSIAGTDCRMNGFDKEQMLLCGRVGEPKCPKDGAYAYVPHSEIEPYFDMAKNYVLADEMYSSDFDASSFVSHQYIIAGQAEASVDYPDVKGLWGCPGGPVDKIGTIDMNRHFPAGYETVCWDDTTLGDELDAAGVPWAYYAGGIGKSGGIWSAYQAVKHIYNGADWAKDVISPQTKFFDDIKHGKLRAVSWVTPTYPNSDHSGSGSKTGPSWVAAVVNAIGKSQYWSSSAIFVFWDDYGGWYDSAPPPYVDYDGLGFRLPLVIVSPYAKLGHISHVYYEHGSILKFIEDTFGLARLAPSDKRATSPASDCFDFTAPGRAFVPIKAPYDENYFRRQPDDYRAPDTE
jgi:phospholipase C